MKTQWASVSLILALTTLTSLTAQGRMRDNRDGLNFGTGFRLLGSDEKLLPTEGSDKTTKSKSEGQAFTPYVGYSFGAINLGLAGLIEKNSLDIDERSTDGNTEMKRKSTSDTKALSIFMRFLFGKVLFFEAGGGYYTETITISNEFKNSTGGNSFAGTQDDYSLRAAGIGSHFGGGLELSIANGFYFTGAYIVRILQLRDMNGGGELGSKYSSQEKRELNFGLAYYYN